MNGTAPRGYVTVKDFAAFLDLPGGLSETDKDAASLCLRAAEDTIHHATGGRFFLPVRGTLAADLDETATTLLLSEDSSVLPEGGLLVIDSEVISYGPLVQRNGGVEVEILSRAQGGTTAAAHTSGTRCYAVRGFTGDGRSLYPGDFLQLHAAWVGEDLWTSLDTTYLRPGPTNTLPYQWLEYGGGWGHGVQVWLAATWGYAWSPPADIQRATLRIAEEGWLRRGNMSNVVRLETHEGSQTVYRDPHNIPTDVAEILRLYARLAV